MQHLKTIIRNSITKSIIFTVNDIILPVVQGEHVYVDEKQYEARQVTIHLDYLDVGGKEIVETIWI